MHPVIALGLLALLFGSGCTVDPLEAEGRPCGPSSPCGTGFRCDPNQWRCVPDLVDLSALEARIADRSASDRDSRDLPRSEARGDLGVDLDLRVDLPAPLLDLPLDGDGDGVLDSVDNCPQVKNPTQKDLDGDKLGDLCDPDLDGDGLANELDPAPELKDTVYFVGVPPAPQTLSCNGTNTWTATGNQICEIGATDGLTCQEAGGAIPSKDYLVISRMTVTANDATQNAGNGIALRISGGAAYLCYVAANQQRLVLGKLTGAGSWSVLQQSGSGSVVGSGPFELRASAQGSKLTCAEATGPSLNTADSSLPNGGVGLHAFHANGCVDSFVVIAP